jgi:glycosyltransferase involved in cell wall biosynthesis
MDGGSTDNTVEIIKKYSEKIHHWESKKDKGQAYAINRGMEMASGDILCWLNSDDVWLPGTLDFIVNNLNAGKAEIIYGNCIHIQENSSLSFGSNVIEMSKGHALKIHDYVIQPSSFWTRKTFEKVGKLNEGLNFVFDWEWFIRAQSAGVHFLPINKYLSMYRMHDSYKTGTGGNKRLKEIQELYLKYSGDEAYALSVEILKKKTLIKSIDRIFKGRGLARFNPVAKRFSLSSSLDISVVESMKSMLGVH